MKIKQATKAADGLSAHWVGGDDGPMMMSIAIYRHDQDDEVAWSELTIDEARKLRDFLNKNLK
jgi:hypothetical protein